MHIHRSKFGFGDIVYLVVNAERIKGMVTRVSFNPCGMVYGVTWAGGAEAYHLEIELTKEFVPDFGVDRDGDHVESKA